MSIIANDTPGTAEPEYAVYWQPGCTSCLKTKEFLERHGIAFSSINVQTTPNAMEHLAALGARSIPVVAHGRDWTYAQDLDDLARFLGVAKEHARLPVSTLVLRIEHLLAAASRYTTGLSNESLETLLPGRPDRAGADLAWHVPMIVEGFLASAKGGCLSFDYFERRPTGAERRHPALLAQQRDSLAAFSQWWLAAHSQLPGAVDTYYGHRPLESVLERTAWHVAQHVRQLESLLRNSGVAPDGALTQAELGGLPLPVGLWDPEINTMGR